MIMQKSIQPQHYTSTQLSSNHHMYAIHHSHLSPSTSTIKSHDKICNAPRHDTYMHVVPKSSPRLSPHDATKHHNRQYDSTIWI
jgi:hypothetical protein